MRLVNTETFIEKAKKIHGEKYDYSKVNYVNNKTDITIICPIHGEFQQKPYKHLIGHGCQKCGNIQKNAERKLKFKNIVERANKIHNNKYQYIEEEISNLHNKIRIICPVHGEFKQIAEDHLNGHGCPNCNESRLEREVRISLEENNIKYEKQKKFDWLDKQTIDYYLPSFNITIECQGLQHFKPIDYFGGEEEFNKIIERDNRKRIACNENGITLLYFSHDNIEFPYDVCTNTRELIQNILSIQQI